MAVDSPTEQVPADAAPQSAPEAIPDSEQETAPAPATGDTTGDAPEADHRPLPAEGEAGAGPSPPTSIVVQCPNCSTSFPLTSQTEALLPPLSDRYMTCPECEGTTWVQTGSSDPEHSTIKCEGCGGSGYLRKDGKPTAAQPPAEMQPPWEGAQWDAERELWV